MAKKNNTNNTNTLPEQEINFIVSDVHIPVSYTHLTNDNAAPSALQ